MEGAIRHAAARTAIAACVFGAALVVAFSGFLGADWRADVPLPTEESLGRATPLPPTVRADYRLAVWAVGRNAHALARHPWRLFRAEPCHPVEKSLALHHPVIAPALLGIPVELLTGDPVATFNAAVFAQTLLCALALFWLVCDWTRSPAAGIAAGLLYAFHRAQLAHPYHLFTSDNAWLLLGLLFARRLFERGRWRDAVGLGLVSALQSSASLYPLLASAALALPFGVWLLWHYGIRRVPPSRLLLAGALAAAGAAFVFAPYLEIRDASLHERTRVFYAAWERFLPGGPLFPGWLALLLALAGASFPRRRALAGLSGDPRPALAAGALLAAVLATGGNAQAQMEALARGAPPALALPNPFEWLRSALPVLGAVRLPSALALGTLQALCLFAGFGAAAAIGSVPARARRATSAALVALAFLESVRPGPLPPRVAFEPWRVRPPEDAIAFFRAIERSGSEGPLLEVPIQRRNRGYTYNQAPVEHLLSAYHHRRTSGCFGSFIAPEVRRLERVSAALPAPAAVARARSLGFTTIVVHHPPDVPSARAYARRVADGAAAAGLERIAESDAMTAWAIPGAAGREGARAE